MDDIANVCVLSILKILVYTHKNNRWITEDSLWYNAPVVGSALRSSRGRRALVVALGMGARMLVRLR